MTVLELGCGAGYFTQELARSGADVVAIDVSPELLEIARSNCSAPNVRYQIENAYALSYPEAVFRFCCRQLGFTSSRNRRGTT